LVQNEPSKLGLQCFNANFPALSDRGTPAMFTGFASRNWPNG